jgi:hypothetical protein
LLKGSKDAFALIARAMLVRAAVSGTKPADFGLLARALAECVQAASAALATRSGVSRLLGGIRRQQSLNRQALLENGLSATHTRSTFFTM